MMKKEIAIALLLFIQASESSAGKSSSRCGEIASSVSIEFQRVDRVRSWGGEIDFARLKIVNQSNAELKFAIGGGDSPLMFHGAFESLQARKYGSYDLWEEFDPVLDTHFAPTAWLIVGSTGEAIVFADLVGPMSVAERSRLLEFRLSVKDMAGCEYVSNSFRLVP